MIAILLTFAAVISIAQIIFCLLRWYGFRYAECEINPKSPKPEPWAWLFEGMYAFGILVSIGVAWWGVDYIAVVLNTL